MSSSVLRHACIVHHVTPCLDRLRQTQQAIDFALPAYLVQPTESLVKHPWATDLGEVGLHEGLRLDEGVSKREEGQSGRLLHLQD